MHVRNGLSWFSFLFYYRHTHSRFWCPLSLLSPSRPTFVLSAPVEDQHGLPLGERYPWEVSRARSGYAPWGPSAGAWESLPPALHIGGGGLSAPSCGPWAGGCLQDDVHRKCQQLHSDWGGIWWRHHGEPQPKTKGKSASCQCLSVGWLVGGSPGRWHETGPTLTLFFQVTGDLFDIMSGQTDVDHPLCEECTDTLLDQLDTQLNVTENECQNYKWVPPEPGPRNRALSLGVLIALGLYSPYSRAVLHAGKWNNRFPPVSIPCLCSWQTLFGDLRANEWRWQWTAWVRAKGAGIRGGEADPRAGRCGKEPEDSGGKSREGPGWGWEVGSGGSSVSDHPVLPSSYLKAPGGEVAHSRMCLVCKQQSTLSSMSALDPAFPGPDSRCWLGGLCRKSQHD